MENETPNTALPLLLTEEEAARYLGVTLTLLRDSRRQSALKLNMRAGSPPYIALTERVIRYRVADLHEWVNALATEGSQKEGRAWRND